MNINELICLWRIEVSNKKKVRSRSGLFLNIFKRARKHRKLRFILWFRLAQYLKSKGGFREKYARRVERSISNKYSVDISIDAKIGAGFKIAHLPGIVITRYAEIGENFLIRQNTTIGIKTLGRGAYNLKIGDNVSIGANSCIISDDIVIGDNVTIGAMSFVNKNISSGCVYYIKHAPVVNFESRD